MTQLNKLVGTNTNLYGAISKSEEQDDGTLKVWGFASSEGVDSDGETITAAAMTNAMADYMKFGAVREMHQAKAAGTAIEMSVQEDGKTFFGAHIVDPIAVTKVKTGVYKGFSIGGKAIARDEVNKSIITDLKLIEVSLVDRPANPEAIFTMYKAEMLDDEPGETGLNKVTGVSFKKSMSSVGEFACILRNIGWLIQDAAWELEYEGDNSKIPRELLDWLSVGAGIFNAMAVEEINELVASTTASLPDGQQVVEMSAKGGDLSKSAGSAEEPTLADVIKSFGELQARFETVVAKSATTTQIDDVNQPEGDASLNKVASPEETLQKLNKLNEEHELLKVEHAKLLKQAAPAKPALNAVISKAEDSVDPTSEIEKLEDIPPEGTIERAEYEMKKVFKASATR